MLDNLPDELVVLILDREDVSAREILRISVCSRRLYSAVCNSVELRYRVELQSRGVVESTQLTTGSSRLRSVFERIRLLEEWDDAWSRMSFDLHGKKELVYGGDVDTSFDFDSGCFLLENQRQEFAIIDVTSLMHHASRLHDLYKADISIVPWKAIPFTENIHTWISDPSQNLLLFISSRESPGNLIYRFYAYALSSPGSQLHPSSSRPYIDVHIPLIDALKESFIHDRYVMVLGIQRSGKQRSAVIFTVKWRDVLPNQNPVRCFDLRPVPDSCVENLHLIDSHTFMTIFVSESASADGLAVYNIHYDQIGNIERVSLISLCGLPNLQKEGNFITPCKFIGYTPLSHATIGYQQDPPLFQMRSSNGVIIVECRILDEEGSRLENGMIAIVIDVIALRKLKASQEHITPWSSWAPHRASVLTLGTSWLAIIAVYGYRVLLPCPPALSYAVERSEESYVLLDFNPNRSSRSQYFSRDPAYDLFQKEDVLCDKSLWCSLKAIALPLGEPGNVDVFMDDRFIVGTCPSRDKLTILALKM